MRRRHGRYAGGGHLTRRNDPTWGTSDEAERANADTFHFANCTPQHLRFNETAKYWQGVDPRCRLRDFGRHYRRHRYPQINFTTLVAKRTSLRHYSYGGI